MQITYFPDNRFHYYEGYTIYEVAYPVRVIQRLGISKLIVTNSAGGVNTDFKPGDLMMIVDHINLMGVNPLIGKNIESFGPRFPDMSQAYSRELGRKAKEAALSIGIELQEGVYAALTGPSYETPAEIKYLRFIGADAVGMSTVPEVIAANHGGINVLGISCITNMAAGVLEKPLNHKDVVENAKNTTSKFIKLIRKTVEMF
ncbi:MAG TPA: purine-nucleoside phosphorylase [Clostridiaceae bacterium]|nr:purine-nucleoside phosphorylase [Clostridiaceae bacterium]